MPQSVSDKPRTMLQLIPINEAEILVYDTGTFKKHEAIPQTPSMCQDHEPAPHLPLVLAATIQLQIACCLTTLGLPIDKPIPIS